MEQNEGGSGYGENPQQHGVQLPQLSRGQGQLFNRNPDPQDQESSPQGQGLRHPESDPLSFHQQDSPYQRPDSHQPYPLVAAVEIPRPTPSDAEPIESGSGYGENPQQHGVQLPQLSRGQGQLFNRNPGPQDQESSPQGQGLRHPGSDPLSFHQQDSPYQRPDSHQPYPLVAAVETPRPTPSDAEPVETVGDVAKELQEMAVEKYYVLPKKDNNVFHPSSSTTIEIEVNYLPLKIKNPKLRIYHYNVNFNPNTSKALMRPALEKIRNRHFGDRHPAFDGKSNMYAAGRPLKELRDSVTIFDYKTRRDKELNVTIELVSNNLNISKLFEYCKEGISSNIPQTEIQATDIALRSGLANSFFPVGRSFFSRPYNPVELGYGIELWYGFYQSAVLRDRPYLNIDVANKAFIWNDLRVLKFLCVNMNCTIADFNEGLKEYQKRDLEQFISGLIVEYEMPTSDLQAVDHRRVHRVSGLGGTASEERFQLGDDEFRITVEQYYAEEKNYTIRYPRLPLLKIGSGVSMVPLELCTIPGNQAVLRKLDERQTALIVKATARPTNERKRRIFDRINEAKYDQNPVLCDTEFGMEVSTSFEKVTAVVLEPPKIAYWKNRQTIVQKGQWHMDEKENFLRPSEIPLWVVLNLNPILQRKVSDLERLILLEGKNVGMNVPPPEKSVTVNRINEHDLVNVLKKFQKNGIRLVFVILSQFDNIYGQVKRAAELRAGILTQCIKSKTVERINQMTVANLLLKVNSKLKGVNHCIAAPMIPAVLREPYMLVGGDVTHPSPGVTNFPSIAAVAASYDEFGFQYNMVYRLQPPRQEMIIDLAEIIESQLLHFRLVNGFFPKKILYFRDGVSEGQFDQVLVREYEAIRRAWMVKNPVNEPKITVIVVQKRHHTRFFPNPKDGDSKNYNVPAGTIVDSKITHPTEVDFYLVSHQSIQGTARPTKYHLLWDDCKIPQVELENLTYYLCHMFARCNRSVSYPAPTYYAHLAAFRAKAWWDGREINMSHLRMEQVARGSVRTNITDSHPMFFV